MGFDMELTQRQAAEYRRAGRRRKSELITEHCRLTGDARNTAVQRFNRANRKKRGFVLERPSGAKGAPVKYRDEHKRLVLAVSDLGGGVCGERLHPQLGEYLRQLETAGELSDYPADVVETVRDMPLISLRRILAELGVTRRKRQLPETADVAKQIPVTADFNRFTDRLGYLGVDYVEHNGGDAGGRFAISGCYVDIGVQWLVRAAGHGKNLASVEAIHDAAMERLPHRARHFHTDNAPAALRVLFDKIGGSDDAGISRSRPYHKNDNAHVEQKNGDGVRKLVGYWRLETPEAVELLNRLYGVEDLIGNYFIASAALIGKDVDELGRVIRKRYDRPRTPYRRLLEHPQTAEETRHVVAARKQELNLVELRQQSIELQTELAHHYRRLR